MGGFVIPQLGYGQAQTGGQNQHGSYPSMSGTSQMMPVSGGSSGGWPNLPAQPIGFSPYSPTYQGVGGMGTSAPPGTVPPSGSLPFSSNNYPTTPSKAGGFGLQGGAATVPTQDPRFTQMYGSMLGGQLGQGLPPFNLSTALPTGGATAPGATSAPLLQQLQQILQSGGLPTSAMQNLATTGDPISQMPAWQAMIGSEQQNIQQNAAQLKEQFGSMGALSSSNAADAMSQFFQQTALGQNAQLTQATATAQENAANRMLQTGEFGIGTESGVGQLAQQLDTQAISTLMQQYEMNLPQFNPMLNLESSFATTYPGVYTKQGGVGSALLGSAGSLMSGASELIPALAGLFGL